MFFGFWQFKTTVSLLLLASCLGHELIRTCDRSYCYERSIARHDINADPLRDWNRRERFDDVTERKNEFNNDENRENRDEVIRRVRENHREMSDSDSRKLVGRRENEIIRREFDNLTTNRRERIRNENRAVQSEVFGNDRRSESSRIDSLAEVTSDNYRKVASLQGRQNFVDNEREDRLVTSGHLNERVNQQDENRESLRFIDRHFEIGREEHEFREENRRTGLLNERTTDVSPEELERVFKENRGNKELNSRREEIARVDAENHSDNTKDIRLPIERVSENERRFENLRNEPQLDERERLNSNQRYSERFSKQENREDRDNRLERQHDSRRSNDHIFDSKHLAKERENVRQLSTGENQRSIERQREVEIHQKSSRFNDDLNEHDIVHRNTNHEAVNLNTQLDKRTQRIRHIRAENKEAIQERDNRETFKQLHNRARSQSENKLECVRARVRVSEYGSESKDLDLEERREVLKLNRHGNRRHISMELNNRSVRQYDNLHEHENILNRNRESRRVDNRQAKSEDDTLQNHNKIQRERTNRAIRQQENYKEQRNIQERVDENRKSRRLDERQDRQKDKIDHDRTTFDQGIEARRSRREYDLEKRRNENFRELKDRHEELRQMEKHEDQGDNNIAFDEKQVSRNDYRHRSNRNNDNKLLQRREANKREHIQRSEHFNEKREISFNRDTKSRRREEVRRNENIRNDERREELKRFEKGRNNRAFNENLNSLNRNNDDELRRDENKRENNQQAEVIDSQRSRSEYDSVERRNEDLSKLDERREELRQLEKRDDESLLRRDEDKQKDIPQSRSIRNEETLKFKDFRSMVDGYKEQRTLFLNNSWLVFGQGALLAYVIKKTLDGKNDIKYKIYQKLQEAVELMGF